MAKQQSEYISGYSRPKSISLYWNEQAQLPFHWIIQPISKYSSFTLLDESEEMRNTKRIHVLDLPYSKYGEIYHTKVGIRSIYWIINKKHFFSLFHCSCLFLYVFCFSFSLNFLPVLWNSAKTRMIRQLNFIIFSNFYWNLPAIYRIFEAQKPTVFKCKAYLMRGLRAGSEVCFKFFLFINFKNWKGLSSTDLYMFA